MNEVHAVLSWSGGKDSALALQVMRDAAPPGPGALITTVTDGTGRSSMHGVRLELLEAQAAATELPLIVVEIPPVCPNEVYEERLTRALGEGTLATVTTVAFGDLFLEDIRAYREQRLAATGRRIEFPLWGRDTAALARGFIASGFEATLVCVDPWQLDPSFAGRAFDRALLEGLPDGVDPCGENGEFHTFVHSGPIFSEPIACRPGEVVERDGFVFCDMLPA